MGFSLLPSSNRDFVQRRFTERRVNANSIGVVMETALLTLALTGRSVKRRCMMSPIYWKPSTFSDLYKNHKHKIPQHDLTTLYFVEVHFTMRLASAPVNVATGALFPFSGVIDNDGGHYKTSGADQWKFVAPVDGLYHCFFTLKGQGPGAKFDRFDEKYVIWPDLIIFAITSVETFGRVVVDL